MIEWLQTKRMNKYGEYGQYAWIDYILINVYRRKYGWGFTCKAKMAEGGVAQTSSDTNEYYATPELAKARAIHHAQLLKEMFVPTEPDVVSLMLENLIRVDNILKGRGTEH